jgi:hypothetical protein
MEESINRDPSDFDQKSLRDQGVPVHQKSEPQTASDRVRALTALAEETLYDEQGPIPNFPVRRAFDEQGRYIPMSPEEREAREDAFRRSMKVINAMDQDPPGSDEEFMRGIDSHRPEGSKLFEGYY